MYIYIRRHASSQQCRSRQGCSRQRRRWQQWHGSSPGPGLSHWIFLLCNHFHLYYRLGSCDQQSTSQIDTHLLRYILFPKQGYSDEIQEVKFFEHKIATTTTKKFTLPGKVNSWPEIWVFRRSIDFFVDRPIWSGIHPEWPVWVQGVSWTL